jgi:hypothetical protein
MVSGKKTKMEIMPLKTGRENVRSPQKQIESFDEQYKI